MCGEGERLEVINISWFSGLWLFTWWAKLFLIKWKMKNTVESKIKGSILSCHSHTQILRLHNEPDSWGCFLLHHSY